MFVSEPIEPRNRIKGNLGEAVVFSLLEQAGNKVAFFGQEWLTTHASTLDDVKFNKKKDDKTNSRPDLAVETSSAKRYLIEVKFSTNGLLGRPSYPKLRLIEEHWPTALLVIVSRNPECHFRVIPRPFFNGPMLHRGFHIEAITDWGVKPEMVTAHEAILREIPISFFKDDP